MPEPFTGGCACGAVRYACDARPFVAYACHCTDCRKRSGSAFGVSVQVPAESVRLVTGAPARRTRVAESGNRLDVHFCAACGTTLWNRNRARPRVAVVTGGSIDDAGRFPIQAHIWTRSALPWVLLGDDLERFETGGDWARYYAQEPDRLRP